MKSIVIIVIKCFILFSTGYLCYNLLFQSFEKINFLKGIIYPSLFLTVLFTIIHVVLSFKAGVRNNFSSIQHEETISSISLEEIGKKIEEKYKWELVERSDNSLVYKNKFKSLLSFGEIISINQNEKELNISSKPMLFTTIFDFGKNYQNIKSVNAIL